MDEATKNLWEVALTLVGFLGAGVAFVFTIITWRRGQRWQRAEQLDKLVQHFESDELLRLACVVLDWTWRKATFRGGALDYKNTDALGALRTPADFGDDPGAMHFPGPQASIRDAYDAFLSFLGRLAAALEGDLISRRPTERYFRYWVERFVRMDRHPFETGIASSRASGPDLARAYVEEYGDPAVLTKICATFAVELPPNPTGLRPAGQF